ncbi:MAG: NAD-dependent epimerase/dehydratase family protein [Acidobacteriota bacterium]|jgi:GDP-L-fucose synthase
MGFWKGRKVVVTGAGGFVGSHVVEALLGEGATVRASVRRLPAPFLSGLGDAIERMPGDLEDPGVCSRLVAGQQAVLHVAGHVGGIGYNRKHHATLFLRNLRPLMNLLEASRDAGAERFLVTSSACVYRRDAPIPTPEEDGTVGSPEPTNAGYGWSKRMQEYLGVEFAREFGLSVAIARPYNAYGPRDDFDPATSHVIPALIRKVLEAEGPITVWGSGRQSRSFLYVKDLARGLLRVAERYAEADPVNLGPEEEITIGDLVRLLARIAGVDREIRFDEGRPEGQPRRACDTRKMKQVLGWAPEVSLEAGLRETVAWYREQRLAS